MTNFATRSRTIPLALALTVLTPLSLFAEAPMTARQMLAQAQNQALTAPSEIKKVELDQSKPAQPIADAGDAGRKPLVIAAAPETPFLTAPAEPVTPTSTPTPDAAKPAPPSVASIVVLPAPSAAPSAAPGSVAKPVSTPVATSPAPETQPTRATQPESPSAATATVTPPQRPAAAPAPSRSKVGRVQTTSNETVASKRSPASRSGASFTVSRSSINVQIGRIMQRPEVQSLLAQYGAD